MELSKRDVRVALGTAVRIDWLGSTDPFPGKLIVGGKCKLSRMAIRGRSIRAGCAVAWATPGDGS